MNSIKTIRAIFVVLVIVATAGCASVSGSSAYRFELVAQRGTTNAATITVLMVDASTGQAVTNANVYAFPPEHTLSAKDIRWVRWIKLKPNGRGGYVYQGTNLHAGETIRLNARVPSLDTLIVGTVEIGATNSSSG